MPSRFRRLVVLVVLALALWGGYEFLCPTFSWERYIDPDEVRLAAIPDRRETYEVHRDTSPRLLRRLVAALNGGRRRIVQTKLAVDDGLIVIHRSPGSPVVIRYGWKSKRGPILFRDHSRGGYGPATLYSSHALRSVMESIRNCKECRVKRPRIPLKSVTRIVLYPDGAHRTLSGSHPPAPHLVEALNEFLSCVDTSFYTLWHDPDLSLFYQGDVNLDTHLTQTTGALLILDPPLSMHTNMMFWGRESGSPAEYQEFKTHTILISDALSVKDEKVVGFSSDAVPNRFYLFDPDGPATPEEAKETAEKWSKIIKAIQEAVANPNARTR